MYTDFCSYYLKSREEYLKAYTDAATFAELFLKNFKERIGLKGDNNFLIKVAPLGTEYNEKSTYSSMEAIKLEESLFWEFTVFLRLEFDTHVRAFPAEILRFNFSYKKEGTDILLAHLGKSHSRFFKEHIESHLQFTVFPDLENAIKITYGEGLNVYPYKTDEIRDVLIVEKKSEK